MFSSPSKKNFLYPTWYISHKKTVSQLHSSHGRPMNKKRQPLQSGTSPHYLVHMHSQRTTHRRQRYFSTSNTIFSTHHIRIISSNITELPYENNISIIPPQQNYLETSYYSFLYSFLLLLIFSFCICMFVTYHTQLFIQLRK